MASQVSSAQFEPLVSRNLGYERLGSAINLFCGRGCRFTVPELVLATGVPKRAIECAKAQPHQAEFRPMSFDHVMSVSKYLGAQFASHYLEPAGLGAYQLMDGNPPLPNVFNADFAKPAETPREKVERLQTELFRAVEELTA